MMMSSVTLVLSLILVGVVQTQEFVPVVADQCFEPMSPGFCRAYFPAFFYNPLTETCECFIFGGCAPNGNNFGTLEECMGTCNVRPQLQTISQTCIDIFGADDPALIVASRPINPRPIVFLSVDSLQVHEADPTVADTVVSATSVSKTTTTSTSLPVTTSQTTEYSITTAPPLKTTAGSKTTSKDFPTTASSSRDTSSTTTTETPTTADTWETESTIPVPSSPSVPVANASTIFTTTNLQTLKNIIQRLMESLRIQQLVD